MKVDDEVYIHSGGYKHKRALIISLLPKMMNVRLLHGRKAGKIVRINQTSAVVVEAQYRTPGIYPVDTQQGSTTPALMRTNQSPLSLVMNDALAGNESGAVAVTVEEMPPDSNQQERENVATPTELMLMMQEEMEDVQIMANMMMQKMNHIRQLMERVRLEPHE